MILYEPERSHFCKLPGMGNNDDEIRRAVRRVKEGRIERNWSTTELANRARGFAREAGDMMGLTQQSISKFETSDPKRLPHWLAYVWQAFDASDDETAEDPYLSTGKTDGSVEIRLLPNHAGLGPGGNDQGDHGHIRFSRDLVERELRAPPEVLLAMVTEGNSMEPVFFGGDQILVDTRRKSLAQPGAFCLWEEDGHVIKFLERVIGSEPPSVRVVSANPIYEPRIQPIDCISIIGRVVWYGRRVQ